MIFLKKILNFYINSSIHAALAVYSLVRITELYFELPYNEPLDYFIFYGTISGYNYIKYAGIAKLHHRSLTDSLKIIQIFSVFSFFATIYYSSLLSKEILYFFIPFLLLTLLYEIPFLREKKINLRSIKLFKIFIISAVWSGVTVLLPLISTEIELDKSIILIFLQRFLFVVALTLPFDIRDIIFDEDSLKTIPQLIGISSAKKLGFVFLMFALVIEFTVWSDSNFKNIFLGIVLLLLLFLMRATTKQSKYYSSFWVEALPIFWFIALLVVNYELKIKQ